MRNVDSGAITLAVKELFLESCIHPDPGLRPLLCGALANETSGIARDILSQLVKNIELAGSRALPLCQDTGMAVVFLDIGQGVHIKGAWLADAVNEGVRQAYQEGFFRKSVLTALSRKNTGDNTPAVLHTQIIPGETIKISVAPKGFGSENMSRVFMLTPADGKQGVIEKVVETVRLAGGNPCPPVVLGVGVGGTFELAALNAKRALLRPLGEPSEDAQLAAMERELLERINALGIGPMGLGGNTTALAVHILEHPTHIAGLPVAVNVQCHCVRHAERTI